MSQIWKQNETGLYFYVYTRFGQVLAAQGPFADLNAMGEDWNSEEDNDDDVAELIDADQDAYTWIYNIY